MKEKNHISYSNKVQINAIITCIDIRTQHDERIHVGRQRDRQTKQKYTDEHRKVSSFIGLSLKTHVTQFPDPETEDVAYKNSLDNVFSFPPVQSPFPSFFSTSSE